MDLKLIYLLTDKILKIIFNNILYASDGVGLKSNVMNRFFLSLKPYLKVSLVLLSIFWFILASLFQLLFHYIPMSVEKINLLIILYISLCALFIINYGISDDIRIYAIKSNLSIKKKKKLILTNEYLGVILSWLGISFFSLPFLLMQVFLNGINGFIFMVQILLVLLYLGFIIGFIKFMFYMFEQIYILGVNKFFIPFFYLVVCLVISLNKNYISDFISLLFDSILSGNLVKLVSSTVTFKINLYDYRIGMISYIVGLMICVFLTIILNFYVNKLCIEKTSKIYFADYNFFKKKYTYIYMNFYRSYGIINTNFFLAYMGTFIILIFFSNRVENIAFFSVYMLLTLFLNNNISQIVLFCKRNRLPLFNVTLMISVFLCVQFVFIISFLCISQVLKADLFIISFLLSGFLLIFCGIYIYCACVYRLEMQFDEKIFKKIGKIIIFVFFIIIIGVELLLNYFNFSYMFFWYLVPMICVYLLKVLILDKIDKIRGFLYDKFD
ncbi:hypothetical protein ACN91_27605 (plasmid) [Bacillus cereus]|uniref:hypothetical protein n=1 Tax=Bacillus cereus TaxID=1396 RepID=UPI0006AD7F99|nr:hypothetical protein [Bacillus cereus]ALC55297.1 hypothetical protein ACN91_27605 [Bacillus cereus]